MVALFHRVLCHRVWPLTSCTNLVAGTLAIFTRYSRIEEKGKEEMGQMAQASHILMEFPKHCQKETSVYMLLAWTSLMASLTTFQAAMGPAKSQELYCNGRRREWILGDTLPQSESPMFISLFLDFHKQSLREPKGIKCGEVERRGE